jgi:uncharacterized membrane protein
MSPIARRWYHPMAIMRSFMIRPRICFAVFTGVVAYLVCPADWPSTERISMSWDAGGIVYLFFVFRLMASCDPSHVRAAAARGDDSRFVILSVILLSIGASFVAIAQLVGHVKAAPADERAFLTALAIMTIIISWTVTQVAFALHYAHEYYLPMRGSDTGGGLVFPGSKEVDYWDFLYFSTSIGATSQTSDTAIQSRSLRRLVTIHAVVAFFFNTAVLALTVNIAASLA